MWSEKSPSRFRESGLSSTDGANNVDSQTLEKLEGRRDSRPVSMHSARVHQHRRPPMGSSQSSFNGTPIMNFSDDQDPAMVSFFGYSCQHPSNKLI